jgi:hypothetical protein
VPRGCREPARWRARSPDAIASHGSTLHDDLGDGIMGVREVIGRRLGRLSDGTNRVLGLAAVIGRQFDVPLLARVAETSEDAVLDALDYERMRPIANQAEAYAVTVTSQGSYGQFCGMLAACLGRWDDAERHFTDAFAMNERFGARPSIVRTRRAWAGMLLDRNAPGDAARARDLIAAGRAEAETLGMARELVRFERLTARLPG